MSIETSSHFGTRPESQQAPVRAGRHAYRLWSTIESLRTVPNSPEANSLVIHETEKQRAELSRYLTQYRHDHPDHYSNPDYYRLVFMEKALTPLVELDRMPLIDPATLKNYQELLTSGAVAAGREMVAAFNDGLWSNQADNVIGVMNEITAVGVYSRVNTIVTLATYAQDTKEKIDLVATQYDESGTMTLKRNVQSKTDISPYAPIHKVALLDAQDFGNRSDGKNVLHDHEMTKLLISEHEGTISLLDQKYLADISADFWPVIEYRLSNEFQQYQRTHYRKAKNDMLFSQNIPKSALANIVLANTVEQDFLTTGTADRT